MHRAPMIVTSLLFVVWFFLVGCTGSQGPPGPLGPAGPAGPVGPPGPAGENASASQTYVGSAECGECHEEIYVTFSLTGHSHALTPIENSLPPEIPYADVSGGLPGPPEGYTWDDIVYVISGYGWKARFVGADGYILTGVEGDATQYNFANEDVEAPAEWVPYHPGEQIPFDCAVCHTTGYAPQGHQNNLEGIVGTWALPGIQCERCHGPGSLHAADPQGIQMVVERASQLCGDCHARDNPALIEASDGFEVNQLQFEDLYNSRHFALDCIDCHDPHASAVFADETMNPTQGIRQVCEACHWQNEAVQNNRKHLGVDCIDCHMPPMAKSAQANLDLHIADVRSHQFAINTDPEAPQFSEDGLFVMPYLTLTYACGHCHNGRYADELDGETLAGVAEGYHTKPTPTPEPSPTPETNEETAVTPTPES
jgi:hypothetical protein